MFGKIAITFSTGFLIETHETCYKTKVNFIPINAVKKNEILQFQVGDQVIYKNGVLRKEEFDNCTRCHKSHALSYAQYVCDCYDDLEILNGEAVLINKVLKRYQHDNGWKMVVQMKDIDRPVVHFVIFEGSPFFKLAQDSNVGDACFFKGIVKSHDEEKKKHDILINLFHIEF